MARILLIVVMAAAQTLRFEPVQPELFGAGGTFVNAWADYDNDGDPDLFVGFDGAPNRLYRNNAGAFVDVGKEAGVSDARSTRAAAWGDFDNDGDSDLLVGFTPQPAAKDGNPANTAGSVLRLYRNTNGKFTDATSDSGLAIASGAVRQPAWIDVDGDGDLDLFVGFRDRANALFQNTGGKFVDVAPSVGLADTRRTVGAVWFDFDEDGDLDVAVANMDGDRNALFRHDAGRFTDVAEVAGIEWGGRMPDNKGNGTVRLCAADVNNDGHFDLFAANYGKNGLLLNQGAGTFKDASAAWGIDIDARYDSCALADFDNDGRIDLYVNGTVTGGVSYPDYLFHNTGERFADVTPENIKALHADHGVQWADIDGDGDLDLALTGAQANGMHSLFANMLSSEDRARSIAVRAVDARGHATLAGAEVRVFAAGTSRLLGARLVDSGSGYDAQNDLPVHLGLPTPGAVDVEVVVPRNGKRASVKLRGQDPRRLGRRPLQVVVK